MRDERIFAKRKILVFILSTVLALSLLLGISAACEEEHTHSLTRHAALSPTCKNDGTIEYWECTGCKKLFSDEAATTEITLEQTIAPATGDHDWGEWRNSSAASCTAEGSRYRTCKVCSEREEQAVAATGHTLVSTPAKAQTCGAAGNVAYWYCASCGKYFSDEVGATEITLEQTVLPATGEHDWDEWQVSYADCTSGGTQTRTCKTCGASESGEPLPPKGHTLTHHEAQAPTCVDRGMKEYWECDECGLYFAAEKAEYEDERSLEELIERATGIHSYGDWVTESEPNCTTAGSRYRECSVCGDKEEESIDAIGHDMTFHAAIEATCTSAGNVAYYSCANCNLNYQDQEGETLLERVTTEKLGHDMTFHAAVEATCTSAGNLAYYRCDNCDLNYADEAGATGLENVNVPAIGHKNKVHHEAQAATCTSDGNIEYWYCSDCDENYADEDCTRPAGEVELPGGHKLSHSPKVPETCATDGKVEYWYCSVCEKYFADESAQSELGEGELVIEKDPNSHVIVRHACSVEGCDYIQPASEYATVGLNYLSAGTGVLVKDIGSAADSQNIVIPAYNDEGKKVVGIMGRAFENFNGESIVIPGTVDTINADAFTGCSAEVIFEPDSLIKKLNDGAFRGYAGERVVLPDGLEEIGQVNGEVFANCGKLTVWIPDSVTFIAPACFKNNTGYVIVQFEGTQAQYDALSKENIYEGLDWDNYQQPESFNVPRLEITIPMPS